MKECEEAQQKINSLNVPQFVSPARTHQQDTTDAVTSEEASGQLSPDSTSNMATTITQGRTQSTAHNKPTRQPAVYKFPELATKQDCLAEITRNWGENYVEYISERRRPRVQYAENNARPGKPPENDGSKWDIHTLRELAYLSSKTNDPVAVREMIEESVLRQIHHYHRSSRTIRARDIRNISNALDNGIPVQQEVDERVAYLTELADHREERKAREAREAKEQEQAAIAPPFPGFKNVQGNRGNRRRSLSSASDVTMLSAAPTNDESRFSIPPTLYRKTPVDALSGQMGLTQNLQQMPEARTNPFQVHNDSPQPTDPNHELTTSNGDTSTVFSTTGLKRGHDDEDVEVLRCQLEIIEARREAAEVRMKIRLQELQAQQDVKTEDQESQAGDSAVLSE